MKKITMYGALAIASLLVSLTSCNKDEESNALEPGTATVSGKLRANLDETDIQLQAVPQGTGITFVVSGQDLDRNPKPGYDYEDIIVRATVNANGEYSATLPAAKKTVNVEVIFDDFDFDATILTTDDEGFQTVVTERRTFQRGSQNLQIVDGQVLVRDYTYNLTGGDFQASAIIRGEIEAQFVDNVGPVTTFGGINLIEAGSDYVDSNDVSVSGGSGSGMTVNISTNASGEVTFVNVSNNGEGYTIGDVVTIAAGDGEAEIEITNVTPQAEAVPEGVMLTFTTMGNNFKVATNENGEYMVKVPAQTGSGSNFVNISGADFEFSSVFNDGSGFVTGTRIYEFGGAGQNVSEGDIIELDLTYNRKP